MLHLKRSEGYGSDPLLILRPKKIARKSENRRLCGLHVNNPAN